MRDQICTIILPRITGNKYWQIDALCRSLTRCRRPIAGPVPAAPAHVAPGIYEARCSGPRRPEVLGLEHRGHPRHHDDCVGQCWPGIEGRGGADKAVAANHCDLYCLTLRKADHHRSAAAVRQVDVRQRRAGFGQNGALGQSPRGGPSIIPPPGCGTGPIHCRGQTVPSICDGIANSALIRKAKPLSGATFDALLVILIRRGLSGKACREWRVVSLLHCV